MKRVASLFLTVMLAVAIVPLASFGVAGAIPGQPTLSAPPDLDIVTSNPVLSWNAVTAATSYRVQVSASGTFMPLLINQLTPNTKFGPTTDLPLGTLHWRVAAIDGGGEGPFSDSRQFTRTAPDGPVLASPASGATLEFPSDPPVFSWEPFPGAKRYEIEIDSEPSFTAPLTLVPTTTNNTSYALTTPPSIGQTFWWRVRAFNSANAPSQHSEVRSYTFDWPTEPQLEYPPDDATVEEVIFQWSATPGAVSYELEVSPTDQFTVLTLDIPTVKGTQYSPPTTIDNGAYFWRVRARNQASAVGAWSEVHTFHRAWPSPDSPPSHRVTLLTPADNDVSVGVPEFTWTPVRLASQYSIEIGDDPFFSPGSFVTCTTQHTSFIPLSACDPDPGEDMYWRVKPLDGPANINGLYSPIFRFQYNPGIPALQSPADGATGLVAPVELTWAATSNDGGPQVAKYKVTIRDGDGNLAETATTFARGYVPQNLDPAEGPFSWYVQIVTASGDGIIPAVSSHREFSFAAPTVFSLTPDPITPPGAGGLRVPHLEWEPVSGATTYEIWRATVPSSTYSLYKSGLKVPGYTDTGSSVTGSFTYFIRAKAGAATLSDGAISSFIVQTLPNTVLLAPDHCPPSGACTVEPNTPTFEWVWDPNATHYRMYLASDPNFTNMLSGFDGVVAHYNRYRPIVSLPDAQAGQATYWYARPCYGTAPEVCGAGPGTFAGSNPPIRAFTKRSNAVQPTAPANEAPGATPLPANANQIIFDWADYLATNLAAAGDAATALEARNYRVQISTTADMQTIIHTSPFVDQTVYTPFAATLPDGPLYWRVQAFDAANNALSFSTVRLVHKRSPLVDLVSPADGADVASVPLFTWESQPFAARYTVEVYKNIDQALAPANRVLSVTTSMTGWIPATSLPAGDYGWRVQRLDVDSRPGPWSAEDNEDLSLFEVKGNQVSLLTPANGTNFVNDNQSFTWTAAPGAAQYRFQSSTVADFSNTLTESIVTVMTSWHSTKVYPNGTYFWRVQTIDGAGNVTANSASRTFTHGPPPPPITWFHPLTPARIMDSRPGSGFGDHHSKWGPNVTRDVVVAGVGGVPADADAVALNVTVTGATAASVLKIWPKGQAETTTSSLNWSAGQTIPNAVTVKVGADKSVRVKNSVGSTDVIFDVVGYYDDDDGTGSGLVPLAPSRLLDTRPGSPVGPGATRDLVVAGGGTGVPADAGAVVLNVTATGSTTGSFLTVWPEGSPRPTASSLNFTAGQTIPNAVTAAVGDDGEIQIYNSVGSVDVIVDLVGYFDPDDGAPYRPLANPIRIQDSRPATKVGPFNTKWGANTSRNVTVIGAPSNVPSTAVGALLNVTVTGTTSGSFLTVYPMGTGRPTASNLNWPVGTTIANSVTAKLGGPAAANLGKIAAYNALGSVDVIMDVYGYYGP